MSADQKLRWVHGVPEFLFKAGIRKGEWQFITKSELASQARPGPGRTLRSQLWAVGMLHSTGSRSELAVVWYKSNPKDAKEKWKSRAMTPGDMGRYLVNAAVEHYRAAGVTNDELPLLRQHLAEQYSKEHIRRELAQLESDGLVERRRKNDGRPLRELSPDQLRRLPSGQVETYFWLKPKPADPESVAREWQAIKLILTPPAADGAEKETETSEWMPEVSIPLMLRGLQIGVCNVFEQDFSNQRAERGAAKALKMALAKPEYRDELLHIWNNSRLAVLVKLREIAAAEAPELLAPQAAPSADESGPRASASARTAPAIEEETIIATAAAPAVAAASAGEVAAIWLPEVADQQLPEVAIKSRQYYRYEVSEGGSPENVSPDASGSPAPSSLLLVQNPQNRSVGPFSGSVATVPTDRPATEGSQENPFKPKIREWLETNVAIPGFDLEEPELAAIAATIQTEAHFKQFIEAAARQESPRGWKVFVKIARSCAKRHETYSAAADRESAESAADREYRERMERIKPKPCPPKS